MIRPKYRIIQDGNGIFFIYHQIDLGSRPEYPDYQWKKLKKLDYCTTLWEAEQELRIMLQATQKIVCGEYDKDGNIIPPGDE